MTQLSSSCQDSSKSRKSKQCKRNNFSLFLATFQSFFKKFQKNYTLIILNVVRKKYVGISDYTKGPFNNYIRGQEGRESNNLSTQRRGSKMAKFYRHKYVVVE